MRKAFIVFLVAGILGISCAEAFAGGAGDCVRPIRTTTKFLGVGAAFEYNYMHSRNNRLENKFGIRKATVKNLNQIYGKGTIGLGDYVNLYGKAGGANYDIEFVGQEKQWDYVLKLEDGIYTGAGLNAHFPIIDLKPVSFGIGFDLQCNGGLNKVKEITIQGAKATVPGGTLYELDGQNSLYLTCRYDIESLKTSILPYVGGYHSWMMVGTAEKLTYDTSRTQFTKKHFQPAYDVLSFGVLVGVDVDIAEYVNLNVEGRFVGETALTTGATLKF